MPYKTNPTMLRGGYAPAQEVATALNKSLSFVHRAVEDGRFEGTRDGAALYVKVDSVVRFYVQEKNQPMIDAAKMLRTQVAKEAKESVA